MVKKKRKILIVWSAQVEEDFAGSQCFDNEEEARRCAMDLARAARAECEELKEPRFVYLMKSVSVFVSPQLPKLPPVEEIVPV